MTSAVEALRKGADTIEQGYWYRGRWAGLPVAHVLADDTVVDGEPSVGTGGCLITAAHVTSAAQALRRHFNVANDESVFEINDSQPLDTGRQWAIDTLRAVADAEKLRLSQVD